MPTPWIQFLSTFKDDAGNLVKDELIGLVENSTSDANDFVQKQGKKLEKYLNQLASSEITPEEFGGYMKHLERLTRMQALKLETAAKASAQRLADGIQDLVLGKLLSLLP